MNFLLSIMAIYKYIKRFEEDYKVINSADEFNSIEHIVTIYLREPLSLNYNQLGEFFRKFDIAKDIYGVYVMYKRESSLPRKKIFRDISELSKFVKLAMPEIKKWGGLEFYIVAKSYNSIFMNVSYQETLGLFYLDNRKNKKKNRKIKRKASGNIRLSRRLISGYRKKSVTYD